MKLITLLDIIKNTAIENGYSSPYIVGGFPRDALLKKIEEIKDIDITFGNEASLSIGQKLVTKLDGATLITFSDGHSRLNFGTLCLDFSNNFRVPNIKQILKKNNIEYKNPIYEEVYSRDFTVNSLLMPIDMSTILDITGNGLRHIKERKLDTCLQPEFTFGSDPKRIIRVIYLCSKLGFEPSKRVHEFVIKHGNLLSGVNTNYMKNKINSALSFNKDHTIKLIRELNLLKYIPTTGLLLDAGMVGK